MKIGLLQCNPLVGDIAGNVGRIRDAYSRAAREGAELCITSELAVLGYPPRDLLLRDDILEKQWRAVEKLAADIAPGPALLAGCVLSNDRGPGNPCFNCAALLRNGLVEARFRKNLLPTYDVFDERRYFEPGQEPGCFEIGGVSVGVTICEDIWNDKDYGQAPVRYASDPVKTLVEQGVRILVNLSSSPFTLGKQEVRESMLGGVAAKYGLPVLLANQVGGNDDLLFDGRSMAFDADGRLVARGATFQEDLLVIDTEGLGEAPPPGPLESLEHEAWLALVTGTRDYVRKSGFSRAVIGLSGGIDSSLTAAVAAEALGPDNVLGVLMPSPFSSRGSIDDSLELADILGIETLTLPIAGLMDAFDETLAGTFAGLHRDVTEENIQSRIRGNLLMALSNKYGSMLLTTGNKSELSVGYCTIYGDMAGGLAVIADVPKTLVYSLCRWLNRTRGLTIPANVIDKPPSAELRPGQQDRDSLPDYEELDDILHRYVQLRQSPETIIRAGHARQTVEQVARLVRGAEFKRRQAPPGLKITDRAFGIGWRMPLAARW